MAARICKTIVWIFGALFVVALALGLIGTFGWFGQERDPLSWVFILPLGLPWTLMLGGVGGRAAPWLGALAPLLNLAILVGICRYLKGRTT